jgi:soluble lytic murein transglycosylase-like protein
MTIVLLVILATVADGPSTWAELRSSLEQKVALEVEAARRTAQADELYRKGVRLLQAGDRNGAVTRFEEAQAAVLDAGEEIYFRSSLRDYFHELSAKIARQMPIRSSGVQLVDFLQPVQEPLVDPQTQAWLVSAVRRAVLHEELLRGIFRTEGVPEELIYVGLVESGYRSDAVSSAGAVGPWQFMPETARRYGLVQWRTVDDRRDLEKSTRAAARYLRDLYELLGDWTLAIAGYNAGEYRVLWAARTSGGKNFWSVRHLLPRETADYVPRVLAAIRIAQSLG